MEGGGRNGLSSCMFADEEFTSGDGTDSRNKVLIIKPAQQAGIAVSHVWPFHSQTEGESECFRHSLATGLL